MNTQALEYIIAISEEKTMAKAAERMQVSQAALGQQLKKLETELETPLFTREHHQMILTDAGKIYVNGARSVLSTYNTALRDIRKLQLENRHKITISYNDLLLPGFATTVVPEFNRLYSQYFVSTVIRSSPGSIEYVLNGLSDLGTVATSQTSHASLEFVPLREDELMLFLPADHPAVPAFRRQGIDFSLLKEDRFIINQPNTYFYTLQQDIFYRYDFVPRNLCDITDSMTAAQMVLHGDGIAFLPSSMEGLSDGYVGFHFPEPVTFKVMLIYSRNRSMTAPLMDLIRIIRSHYGK